MKEPSANVSYIQQDHLSGTSVMSDAEGDLVNSIKYYPYGDSRKSQGNLGTDKLFTGQRRDIETPGSELYYYGARYYDPTIGRFISPDPIVQNPANPQTLNRYSYVLNNPLRYTDPTGHYWYEGGGEPIWVEDEPPDDGNEGGGTGTGGPSLPIAPSQPIVPKGPKPSLPNIPFPADVPEIQDFFGAFNNLPNTALALILAAMNGGVFKDGPRGTVEVTDIDPESPIGRLMAQINGDPITVGYVIMTTMSEIEPDTERHELGHVTQGGILGIFYLPVVGVDRLIHPRWEDRWIERTVPRIK